MNNINFHKLFKLIVEENKLCTKKQYNKFIIKLLLWFIFATLLIAIPGTIVLGNIIIPLSLIISLIGLITILEILSENLEIFQKLDKLFSFWPVFIILNVLIVALLKFLNY